MNSILYVYNIFQFILVNVFLIKLKFIILFIYDLNYKLKVISYLKELNNISIKTYRNLKFRLLHMLYFYKILKKLYITFYYNFNNYSNIITNIDLNYIYNQNYLTQL